MLSQLCNGSENHWRTNVPIGHITIIMSMQYVLLQLDPGSIMHDVHGAGIKAQTFLHLHAIPLPGNQCPFLALTGIVAH